MKIPWAAGPIINPAPAGPPAYSLWKDQQHCLCHHARALHWIRFSFQRRLCRPSPLCCLFCRRNGIVQEPLPLRFALSFFRCSFHLNLGTAGGLWSIWSRFARRHLHGDGLPDVLVRRWVSRRFFAVRGWMPVGNKWGVRLNCISFQFNKLRIWV